MCHIMFNAMNKYIKEQIVYQRNLIISLSYIFFKELFAFVDNKHQLTIEFIPQA